MKRSLLVFALVAVLGLIALADGVGVPEHLGLGGRGKDVAAADVPGKASSGRADETMPSEEETPDQDALQDELDALPPGPPESDEAATVVAEYAKFPIGWVFVYDDGRVLWHPWLPASLTDEALRALPSMRGPRWIFERRLTADGLDLVRSGAIKPKAFLREWVAGTRPQYGVEWKPRASLPAGLWADAVFKTYVSSWYAVCSPFPKGATRALHRLPAPARTLLRGRERTYHDTDSYGRGSDVECFEVSADEASVLEEVHAAAKLFTSPILPHGEPVGGDPG